MPGSARALRHRYWRLPRTLSARLIAGLVALLSMACALVGLVTYVAIDRALTNELSNQLQAATSVANSCLDSFFSPPPADNDHDADNDYQQSQSHGEAGQAVSNAITSMYCEGLGNGTFIACLHDGQWSAAIVPSTVALTAQDKDTLSDITPSQLHRAGGPLPVIVPRHLESLAGEYVLTVVDDPNGTYVTGLSLSGTHDLLKDVAFAEAGVFGAVLLFAGVLGTFWVRFSLRPLRRVAATASQVAELPLETGEISMPAGVPDTDPATETGRVGLAFNRMLGHVESALRRRAASEARLRRFAADASHELRTPLAAIRGYAELALRHPGDSPDEAVTHALGRVLSESTRMSVLVDDLLLLARLDAGRPLNTDPVDMTRLAIEATSDAQVARPGHRWMLELPDDSVLVRGDEHRLHQVLANLLSNAGRHTPDGTTVTVRVSDALPGGEPGTGPQSVARGTLPGAPRLVMSVTDNGPGIPEDLLPDLFERFTRADTSRSHATNASSTGLGLAIVDAVVAAHHGAVLVTSRPGLTRFTMVLPQLTEPAGPGPRRPPGQSARGRPAATPIQG
jgi:two-component system, OmpR family, sensor kinase